jgi:hypothetical protein
MRTSSPTKALTNYVGDMTVQHLTPVRVHTAGVLCTPAACWPDGEASLWADEWAVVGIQVGRELGWVTGALTHDVWLRVVAALEQLSEVGDDENDLYSAMLLWVCHRAGIASLPGDVLTEIVETFTTDQLDAA